MNPFQSDNIWKKKARQGKAQQHPLTPQQEWQKQVNSSSLWLGGGVVLKAGDIEYNCTFPAQLRALRQSMAAETASVLFEN